jgi:zinc/manganese transport system ATP-binding protein
VQGLSGEFATGSLRAVVGPNGAGKSSLMAAMAGVLRPLRGAVYIQAGVRARMAWLPQQSAIDRSFPISTFDLVAMGLWAQVGSFKAVDSHQRDLIHQALAAVRLAGVCSSQHRRSVGGSVSARIVCARMVAKRDGDLLGEPFSAVDARTTAELLDVVAAWHAEGRTVIAVLHAYEQVKHHFTRTLLMARRCEACGPSVETLSSANLLSAVDLKLQNVSLIPSEPKRLRSPLRCTA